MCRREPPLLHVWTPAGEPLDPLEITALRDEIGYVADVRRLRPRLYQEKAGTT